MLRTILIYHNASIKYSFSEEPCFPRVLEHFYTVSHFTKPHHKAGALRDGDVSVFVGSFFCSSVANVSAIRAELTYNNFGKCRSILVSVT